MFFKKTSATNNIRLNYVCYLIYSQSRFIILLCKYNIINKFCIFDYLTDFNLIVLEDVHF